MLRNGKVLVFDAFGDAPNSERVWDPATGSFTSVPNGSNLFCAGQASLPDGREAIIGGHITAYDGLNEANLFDPATNTWTGGRRRCRQRWYPTVTAYRRRPLVRHLRRQHRPRSHRSSAAVRRYLRHTAGDLQPDDERVDATLGRGARHPSLSVHVRDARRSPVRRGSGHRQPRDRSLHRKLVDHRDKPDRRRKRRHVSAWKDSEERTWGNAGVDYAARRERRLSSI